MENIMCKCINIEIQSYKNQTLLTYPDWFKSQRDFRAAGIDNCILEEIKGLWEAGIQTTESCCGHNKAQGYIAVLPEYIAKMEELGYRHLQHPVYREESGWDCYGYRGDVFRPKSVFSS